MSNTPSTVNTRIDREAQEKILASADGRSFVRWHARVVAAGLAAVAAGYQDPDLIRSTLEAATSPSQKRRT